MLEVGHQIGGYTILRLIGKGGMSEVYLGEHRRVARRAAIKVLIPELSQKAAAVDRFFSEARATSLIRHPGIIEIFDCDVHEGQAFIVMQLLEGENLGEYLQRTGPLSRDLGLVLGVGVNVARAVGAAHELTMATIIHRDLKPDNIFLHLPGDGRAVEVKVLDFGIAKLAEQGRISHTSTSVLMGTPSYMSPEQCRGAKAVDARSDIYSLGCVLYESLAGTPPFVREGVGDLIIAHVSEQATPLTDLVPGLPPGLAVAIGRMMAKRPEERPQSMSEVASDLLSVAAELGLPIDERLQPHEQVRKPLEMARATLVMTPTTLENLASPPDRPRVYSQAEPRPSAPLGDSGDDASSAAHRIVAGGTQLMPDGGPVAVAPFAAKKTTTLGSAAREVPREPRGKKRWPLILGVAGVAAMVGIVAVVSRGGESTSARAVPAPPPERRTPALRTPAEPSPPTPPVASGEPPEMVTIALSGVQAGSVVVLDGLSSAIPLHVARGPELHRIIVRAPGGAERLLEIDGSEDRTLDVGPLDGPPGRSTRSPTSSRGHEHAPPPVAPTPATTSSPKKSQKTDPKTRPTRGRDTPEAITDI
jgi:serine/threonine protein kinase